MLHPQSAAALKLNHHAFLESNSPFYVYIETNDYKIYSTNYEDLFLSTEGGAGCLIKINLHNYYYIFYNSLFLYIHKSVTESNLQCLSVKHCGQTHHIYFSVLTISPKWRFFFFSFLQVVTFCANQLLASKRGQLLL
jgi:hypothetical protein